MKEKDTPALSSINSGFTNGIKFEQTPVRIAQPGHRVEVECSHDDSSQTVMYWYEQREDSTALRLIGFGYRTGEPTYEPPFTSRFQLKRESVQKGSLTISNVTEADSALYFCASSFTNGIKFEQTPVRIAQPGHRVEVECSHDDSSYPVMYWFEQREDSTALRLIGFGYNTGEPTYEPPFTSRFQLKRESVQKGSLTISNVTEADSALYFCASSFTNGIKFEQTPVRIAQPGHRVEVECSHDDSSYYYMYWYEQREDSTALRLIGFGYSTGEPTYEPPFTSRFQLKRESVQKGSLTISNVTEADSALYFCASSFTNGIKFEQTPVRIAQPGHRVEVECSHDDSSYYYMYWYEQREDSTALRLIGFGYSTGEPTYEPPFTSRFQLKRESVQKGSLTISNVTEADSALYFCASSFTNGIKFEQTPVRIAQPGHRVEVECSHDDSSQTIMSWYEQREDSTALRLIGFGYKTGEPTYEPPFTSRFQLKRESVQKGSLTISNVTEADSALYFCASSFTNGIKFEQTPVRIAQPGHRVEVECSHDDSSYLIMYWYEQREDSTALRLIGFGYNTGEPTYEPPFTSRFQLKRESVQKGSLTISNVTEADSALYFCASSKARCCTSPLLPHKNTTRRQTGKPTEVSQMGSSLSRLLSGLHNQDTEWRLNAAMMTATTPSCIGSSRGRTVQLSAGFGYRTGETTYEPPFTSQFQLKRESIQKGSLSISNVTEADSALYFCASTVSHAGQDHSDST
ncbi:hypothetical protein AAFF_G00386930 [Aldrovandia affinis]|uniref:Ig-like domain-containing protein n=1 Tax=Aldrovandia affinis TaxID=143900 RepID=A0AAD7WL75_9TELE|nr:hypothetical protein AAFF_G00386930 [Aldrovandia affinis]